MSYAADTLVVVDEPDFWLRNFWLPIAVTVVGGLVLAALASAVSKTVRQRFWRPIGRGLRWLTTVRLTTTGKVAAARGQADEMIQEQQRQYVEYRRAAEDKLSTARVRIASLTDQVEGARVDGYESGRAAGFQAGRAAAASEIQPRLFEQYAKGRTEARAEAETAIEDARAESWAAGRAKGYAAGRAEGTSSPPASARPDVVVEPVWRITRIDATNFWLENVQEGVGQISDVRIRTVIGEFSFTSGNQWPGPWGGGAAFSGELVSAGVKLGARMEISWIGPNGRQHEADARIEPLPREPRRGVIL